MFWFKKRISYAEASTQLAAALIGSEVRRMTELNPLAVTDEARAVPPSPEQRRVLHILSLFNLLKGLEAASPKPEIGHQLASSLVAAYEQELVRSGVFSSSSQLRALIDECKVGFSEAASAATSTLPEQARIAESVLRLCGEPSKDIAAIVGVSGLIAIQRTEGANLFKKLLRSYSFTPNADA